MIDNIITFQEAIEKCEGQGKHILLGNGFSIACKKDIFLYEKLFETADFKNNIRLREIFNLLKTYDFEKIIRILNDTTIILSSYTDDSSIINQMQYDAKSLKEILIQTICRKHPDFPSEIKQTEYESCRSFLSNFDRIFTLNYDILLYWTMMNSLEDTSKKQNFNDGFGKIKDINDYVVWDSKNNASVYFLHGALHIFDSDDEIKKFTWINTGKRLIDQIRSALNSNKFPIFVSEGTSKEKKAKIFHNAYLSKAYRSFESIGKNLFIFGHSLDENDSHILHMIASGKIENVYISIYGDGNSSYNKKIILNANKLKEKSIECRKNKILLNIHFYDAESAHVWG